MLRRAAAAVLFVLLLAIPRSALAIDIPDPANSSVPEKLYLVGQTAGVADVCGDFVVHVAKIGGGNYSGGVVTLSFKFTPDLDFAATQPYPGVTVDCSKREVYATTDVNGNAHFRVVGSVIQHPGGGYRPGPCDLQVLVDGVCLGSTKAVAFDLDGQDGVTANDVSLWVTDFFCGAPYTCVEDYDAVPGLNAADLSILVGVLNSHRSQETGDLCLAPPPPPPAPITGGITIAMMDCNAASTGYSTNFCTANKYTDFVGSVTLAGGMAQYTGVEAIVKVTDTSGGALPAYWRFDNISIPSNACPNGAGLGCNAQRLSIIPAGFRGNGDNNCISDGGSAYGELAFTNISTGAWTLWPHPVTNSTSDEQVRAVYAINGCDQGSIPANTATVVFGLRMSHGPNPNNCAGCGSAANILFTIEELRLTKKVASKASCSCLIAHEAGHGHSLDGGDDAMLIIHPAPGDSNAIFADGHRPSNVAVEPTVETSRVAWLSPAVPNPTGRGTVIKFYVPQAREAHLMIFDAAGRRLRVLANGGVAAGVHQIDWDGRDDSGAPLSSGIYFVRLTVGGETFSQSVAIRQ